MDLHAYVVTRMPATFATIRRALCELPKDFEPRTLLDVGSGPGTASWAAAAFFPSLTDITFLDKNSAFLAMAKSLTKESANSSLRSANAVLSDVLELGDAVAGELAIAAYTLAELPMAKVSSAAKAMWNACTNTLVIIEPGTPSGFERIRAARTLLINSGAHILAPCPHAHQCPIIEPDWCHFKVRLMRSREHLHAKSARVPFEDEKFSYLIASRYLTPPHSARILRPPIKSKPAIEFKLCTATGLLRQSVATRDKAEYKRVRKLEWGDTF